MSETLPLPRTRSALTRLAPPENRGTRTCGPLRPVWIPGFASVLCFGSLPPQLVVKGTKSPRKRRTEMKIEQVREVASKALEHLSESLNQGQSEVLRNYLAAMGKFHRYSMSNVLSIITQRPDATRVAGYQTWRKLHRQVIRGANGIVIFAPLARRTVDANECGIETQPENLVGSRAAVVFGVADTAGNPLPSLSQFGRRLSSQSVPRFRPLVKK